jgi:signal transduction histidine kinase
VTQPGEQASAPPPADDAPREPGRLRGLSGKVFALIVTFIMLGEVLIYVPSIANYRLTWLGERIEAAQIASLVLEATPDHMVSKELKQELLRNANTLAVALKRADKRQLMLGDTENLTIDEHYDLPGRSFMMSIWDAFETLASAGDRTVLVVDESRHEPGDFIEIVITEAPLHAAMIGYSTNILALSMILSVLVAALVYLCIDRMLVRPMRRLTLNMVRFSDNPEDADRIITPSGRHDEIGLAETRLANMQVQLASTLQQQSHLAALGLAVSKISHDLRNMLSSAQIISDRLSSVQDPTVQKFAPKLIGSLDRAIDFCADTLKYGRAREAPPRRERFALAPLIDEVFETSAASAGTHIMWRSDVATDFVVDADREHMFRILTNLCRNAVQAFDGRAPEDEGPPLVQLKAWREGAVVTMEVRDNGPGLPPRARENLFNAFRGSVRPGGTGLGLAISAELARAHGGELRFVDAPRGAVFQVVVPDRITDISSLRGDQRLGA